MVFSGKLRHHCGVDIVLMVLSLLPEPVHYVIDAQSDVVRGLSIVSIVLNITSLIQKGIVYEVPVGLPSTSGSLDIVSISGALNERVSVFFSDLGGVSI